MAHEITATDGLVLTQKSAWHGLGKIVEAAPSPTEALAIAGLGWSVEQLPLWFDDKNERTPVPSHVLNLRSDTRQPLGVVGVGYQPVQNIELAEFAAALGESGEVKIESAGSIRGGRRVWFLVRGESIWVGRHDEVAPYLLLANAHDGTLAVTCQPTTIRVVCKNTLHTSLRAGKRSSLAVRFRHEGTIADKLADAKRALGLFDAARKQFAEQAATLNAQSMNRDELQRFWLDVYSATLEPIPSHPTTSREKRQVAQAQVRLGQWAANFDRDRERTGNPASAWAALNAVTEWFDHQRMVRASDQRLKADQRLMGSWWGDAAVAKRGRWRWRCLGDKYITRIIEGDTMW